VKVEDDGGAGRAKKLKMDQEKHSYPSLTMPEVEDDIANECNVALLKQESAKPKPTASNVIPLMTRTFQRRRQWILDEAKPIKEIIAEYPCLRRAVFVSSFAWQAFCLLMYRSVPHIRPPYVFSQSSCTGIFISRIGPPNHGHSTKMIFVETPTLSSSRSPWQRKNGASVHRTAKEFAVDR